MKITKEKLQQFIVEAINEELPKQNIDLSKPVKNWPDRVRAGKGPVGKFIGDMDDIDDLKRSIDPSPEPFRS